MSSSVSVAPIASRKPSAIDRPRPTPSSRVVVAEALEREQHPSPVRRRDAAPTVHDPDLHGVGPDAGLHVHRDAGRAVAQGVGDDVGQAAFEQDRIGHHQWELVERVDRQLGRRRAEVVGTGGDGVGDRGRADRHRQHADLQAARVEEVADHDVEPVGLGLDGRQRVGDLGRGPRHVRVAHPGDHRLDRRERAAQVVGDGAEQRGAHRVGLGQRRRLGGVPGELLVLDGHDQLVGDHVQHALVVGRQRSPVELQDVLGAGLAAADLQPQCWCRMCGATGGDRRCRPGPSSRRRNRTPSSPNVVRSCSSISGNGSRSAARLRRGPGERLGLEPRPPGLQRASRRRVDERAEGDGNGEEDQQGDDVLRMGDREGVQRQDEVPVDEERPCDGGDTGHPTAAERGDDQHQAEDDQQHRRQLDPLAQRDRGGGQRRQCDDRQEPRHEQPPAVRPRPAARAQAAAPTLARRLIGRGDHVDVDRRSGG